MTGKLVGQLNNYYVFRVRAFFAELVTMPNFCSLLFNVNLPEMLVSFFSCIPQICQLFSPLHS